MDWLNIEVRELGQPSIDDPQGGEAASFFNPFVGRGRLSGEFIFVSPFYPVLANAELTHGALMAPQQKRLEAIMPCYIQRIKPPSQADFKLWQSIGYIGTWDDYCRAKGSDVGQTMFLCGDLGQHCADCAACSEFLCDYPVGDGKTCDRPLCDDHAKEIGVEIHYCQSHHKMWTDFKARGGMDDALRNVIAFKNEK